MFDVIKGKWNQKYYQNFDLSNRIWIFGVSIFFLLWQCYCLYMLSFYWPVILYNSNGRWLYIWCKLGVMRIVIDFNMTKYFDWICYIPQNVLFFKSWFYIICSITIGNCKFVCFQFKINGIFSSDFIER